VKILKLWSQYCGHYIFFIQNEQGVFVYYTYDGNGNSTTPSWKTKTGWRRCSYKELADYYGEPSSELEFVVLTGHSIEATLERDIDRTK